MDVEDVIMSNNKKNQLDLKTFKLHEQLIIYYNIVHGLLLALNHLFLPNLVV